MVKRETKDLLGENRDYLTIQILHNSMTAMVPCENAHTAGLRRVIDGTYRTPESDQGATHGPSICARAGPLFVASGSGGATTTDERDELEHECWLPN